MQNDLFYLRPTCCGFLSDLSIYLVFSGVTTHFFGCFCWEARVIAGLTKGKFRGLNDRQFATRSVVNFSDLLCFELLLSDVTTCNLVGMIGRGDWIRTNGLRLPKPSRYQTALRPVADCLTAQEAGSNQYFCGPPRFGTRLCESVENTRALFNMPIRISRLIENWKYLDAGFQCQV